MREGERERVTELREARSSAKRRREKEREVLLWTAGSEGESVFLC